MGIPQGNKKWTFEKAVKSQQWHKYYSQREEKIVAAANQDIEGAKQSMQEILGVDQIHFSEQVTERLGFSFALIGHNIQYLLSSSLQEFRLDFFKNLYGIHLPEGNAFTRTLGNFEYVVMLAVMPNLKELSKSELPGVRAFFKKNLREFVGLEKRFSPWWIFDAVRDPGLFEKASKVLKGEIRRIKDFVENKYEVLLQNVRIQEGVDDCTSTLCPCICQKIGEIEGGILDVMFAHLRRIEVDSIITSFLALVDAYQIEVLNAQVSIHNMGRVVELQDMGSAGLVERQPLLGGSEGCYGAVEEDTAGSGVDLDKHRARRASANGLGGETTF